MRRHEVIAFVCLAACRAPAERSERIDAAAVVTPPPRHPGVCEPTVSCGVWSPCTWLEVDHVEPSGGSVYRVSGSDAGSRFTRVRACFPEDAGHRNCSVYCTPTGTGCVDALTADATCTRAGPPQQSPFLCDIRGDACVTRP